MKTAKRWMLAATLLAVPAAQAADGAFLGPAIYLGVGASTNHLGYGSALDGLSSSNSAMAFDLQYRHGLPAGERGVLTLGAGYDLGVRRFGQVAYAGRHVDSRLDDHWSVSVAPGYRLRPSTLLYLTLAYHGARGRYADSTVGTTVRSHSGYGYGLGADFALAHGWAFGVALQHVRFNRTSGYPAEGRPQLTELMMRIGYRF